MTIVEIGLLGPVLVRGTPGSLAQPGAYGLGTQGGPARRLDLLTAAGFQDARLVADTGQNLVLAATKTS